MNRMSLRNFLLFSATVQKYKIFPEFVSEFLLGNYISKSKQ